MCRTFDRWRNTIFVSLLSQNSEKILQPCCRALFSKKKNLTDYMFLIFMHSTTFQTTDGEYYIFNVGNEFKVTTHFFFRGDVKVHLLFFIYTEYV